MRLMHGVAAGLAGLGLLVAAGVQCRAQAGGERAQPLDRAHLFPGPLDWEMSPILVGPTQLADDFHYSMKDPSVVYFEGKWRLFCTVRGRERTHQVEYLSFEDWASAKDAPHYPVSASSGYFCAPQVFFFEPQAKWYMICQASDEAWDPKYCAAYSTTDDISDPSSWAPLQPLEARFADGKAGLDFWVICDEEKAHLFFTTLDGRMWREETPLESFPTGWSEPELAIQGDIFEASHTYRLLGEDAYLTLVEAQNGRGWRYFKAYAARTLDGEWVPLAAERDDAFASMANALHPDPRWTDSISHGELLRVGCNQRLDVDPGNLAFLFQGVLDADREGKEYGQIPWRLGLLTLVQDRG